jgi:hypothetical protein
MLYAPLLLMGSGSFVRGSGAGASAVTLLERGALR